MAVDRNCGRAPIEIIDQLKKCLDDKYPELVEIIESDDEIYSRFTLLAVDLINVGYRLKVTDFVKKAVTESMFSEKLEPII